MTITGPHSSDARIVDHRSDGAWPTANALGIAVATQVSELWWTLIAGELRTAQEQLRANKPSDASRTLGRVVVHFEPLNATWRSIATTTPKDLFGMATFDSWRYHYTLYVLGGTQAEHLRSLASSQHRPQISSALVKPTVYDDVLAYFNRIGMRVPEHVLERDPSAPYVPSLEVEQIWREVYEDPYPDATLQQLGETLMDTATALTDWRCRCLMTMRRTFVGRSASIPVEWAEILPHSTNELSFPELWSARRCVTESFDVQTQNAADLANPRRSP